MRSIAKAIRIPRGKFECNRFTTVLKITRVSFFGIHCIYRHILAKREGFSAVYLHQYENYYYGELL